MSEQNRTTLKGYFETGDYPTQQQFADLIDSAYNKVEDSLEASGSGLPTQTDSNVDAMLVSTGGTASWKGGDYTLDTAVTTAGNSINNPYIAGTNGESRLILRGESAVYIMLPNNTRGLFTDDQVYQVDASLNSQNHYIFAEPHYDGVNVRNDIFSRASRRLLTETETNNEKYLVSEGVTADVYGYCINSQVHYTFEAYPSSTIDQGGQWVPVANNALLLQNGEDEYDGMWGNSAEPNSGGKLCRFTLSETEYLNNNNSLSYHGWGDRQYSTLTVNGGTTLTFELGYVSDYYVYFNGIKKTMTESKSIIISDQPEWTQGVSGSSGPYGIWFITLDNTLTLRASKHFWSLLDYTAIPVCFIHVFDDSGEFLGYPADERHSYLRSILWHKYTHDNVGCSYKSGFDSTPTFNNDGSFEFDGGILVDEDLYHDTRLLDSNYSNTLIHTTAQQAYRTIITLNTGTEETPVLEDFTFMAFTSGTNVFVKTVSGDLTAPITSKPQWDDNGVLTTLQNDKYGIQWIYGSGVKDVPLISVVGQGEYDSVSDARLALTPDLADVAVPEWKLLYRVIYKTTESDLMVVSHVDNFYNIPTGPNTSAIPLSIVQNNNVSGSFVSSDNKLITVTNGIITSIAPQ